MQEAGIFQPNEKAATVNCRVKQKRFMAKES
jgi:hypothetical protein